MKVYDVQKKIESLEENMKNLKGDQLEKAKEDLNYLKEKKKSLIKNNEISSATIKGLSESELDIGEYLKPLSSGTKLGYSGKSKEAIIEDLKNQDISRRGYY